MKSLPPLLVLAGAVALAASSFAADEPAPDRRPERPQRPERPERVERPERPERREGAELGELRQRRDELARRLDELVANGQEREAARVKEQLADLNRELGGPDRRPQDGRERRPGSGPGQGMDQRHQHLREAMEHLRTAGLPDLAERVGREGKQRLAGNDGVQRPPGQPREPDERFEQVQRQLRELHGTVENLQRQVERLSRERESRGPRNAGPDEKK